MNELAMIKEMFYRAALDTEKARFRLDKLREEKRHELEILSKESYYPKSESQEG